MRLLRTSDISFHEFFGTQVPKYAILSHRWEEEEVGYKEVRKGRAEGMKGFMKTQKLCSQAANDGFEYVWIDCCCIDKRSSAELSEAIISMFNWYRDAEICYAYLSDVPPGLKREDHDRPDSAFCRSKWFTRGWTLQELLAPREVIFLDSEWALMGLKSQMTEQLGRITGIHQITNFEDASVAQKMSWVSRRETTRVEDIAYCMLGLFGVHMPPLYGEGQNAFLRLQLEILKISDDQSLFAWQTDALSAVRWPHRGLLAWHPQYFQEAGNIRRCYTPSDTSSFTSSYAMTNKGLHIDLPMAKRSSDGYDMNEVITYQVMLNCIRQDEASCLGIFMIAEPNRRSGAAVQRVLPNILDDLDSLGNTTAKDAVFTKTLYIEQPLPFSKWGSQDLIHIKPLPLNLRNSYVNFTHTAKVGNLDRPRWLEIQPCGYMWWVNFGNSRIATLSFDCRASGMCQKILVLIGMKNGTLQVCVYPAPEDNHKVWSEMAFEQTVPLGLGWSSDSAVARWGDDYKFRATLNLSTPWKPDLVSPLPYSLEVSFGHENCSKRTNTSVPSKRSWVDENLMALTQESYIEKRSGTTASKQCHQGWCNCECCYPFRNLDSFHK